MRARVLEVVGQERRVVMAVPVGVAVLSLTGEGTGGILLIPMNTVLQVPGVGPVRVDEAYKRGGVDGVKLTIEGLLGAGMQESVVVDDKRWADLTAPLEQADDLPWSVNEGQPS